MFGAKFSEKARLLELSDDGFSLMFYRPISDGIPLTVNFHPYAPGAEYLVNVITTRVDNHLDGTQTVHVRLIESPQLHRTVQAS